VASVSGIRSNSQYVVGATKMEGKQEKVREKMEEEKRKKKKRKYRMGERTYQMTTVNCHPLSLSNITDDREGEMRGCEGESA